jgi:hypothetical protein
MYEPPDAHISSSEGLLQVRVHDLKHTYGRHMRAAGVSFVRKWLK